MRDLAVRIEAAVTALADEVADDWYTARRRAHAGDSPSLAGPDASAWRRAWALGDRRSHRGTPARALAPPGLTPTAPRDLRAAARTGAPAGTPAGPAGSPGGVGPSRQPPMASAKSAASRSSMSSTSSASTISSIWSSSRSPRRASAPQRGLLRRVAVVEEGLLQLVVARGRPVVVVASLVERGRGGPGGHVVGHLDPARPGRPRRRPPSATADGRDQSAGATHSATAQVAMAAVTASPWSAGRSSMVTIPASRPWSSLVEPADLARRAPGAPAAPGRSRPGRGELEVGVEEAAARPPAGSGRRRTRPRRRRTRRPPPRPGAPAGRPGPGARSPRRSPSRHGSSLARPPVRTRPGRAAADGSGAGAGGPAALGSAP